MRFHTLYLSHSQTAEMNYMSCTWSRQFRSTCDIQDKTEQESVQLKRYFPFFGHHRATKQALDIERQVPKNVEGVYFHHVERLGYPLLAMDFPPAHSPAI